MTEFKYIIDFNLLYKLNNGILNVNEVINLEKAYQLKRIADKLDIICK